VKLYIRFLGLDKDGNKIKDMSRIWDYNNSSEFDPVESGVAFPSSKAVPRDLTPRASLRPYPSNAYREDPKEGGRRQTYWRCSEIDANSSKLTI
jgi:hypothetical protein